MYVFCIISRSFHFCDRSRCLRNPDQTVPGPPGTGTSIPAPFRAIGIGGIPALVWGELCRFPAPGPCISKPGKFFRGHSIHLILCTKTISFWMVGSRFQKCIYRSAKSVNVTHPRNSSFVIGSIVSVRGLQFRSPVFGSHDTAIICTLLISHHSPEGSVLGIRAGSRYAGIPAPLYGHDPLSPNPG